MVEREINGKDIEIPKPSQYIKVVDIPVKGNNDRYQSYISQH